MKKVCDTPSKKRKWPVKVKLFDLEQTDSIFVFSAPRSTDFGAYFGANRISTLKAKTNTTLSWRTYLNAHKWVTMHRDQRVLMKKTQCDTPTPHVCTSSQPLVIDERIVLKWPQLTLKRLLSNPTHNLSRKGFLNKLQFCHTVLQISRFSGECFS